MKLQIAILLTLCLLSWIDFSYGVSDLNPEVGLQQNKLRMPFDMTMGSLQHSLFRRQSTTQDRCAEAFVDFLCITTYGNVLVQIATQCGHNDFARDVAEGCATNENREFCRIATRNAPSPPSSCTLSNDICSTTCRSYLRSLRSSLGCCIDSYLNTTDSSDELQELFSYELWSRCGVETVSQGCSNGLNYRPVFSSQVCTDDDFHQRIATAECSSPYKEGLENAYTNAYVCQDSITFLDHACQINENGERCGAEIRDELVALSDTGTTTVVAVLVTCDSATTNNCPSGCRSALRTFEKDLGCCANTIYNNPETDRLFPRLGVLWEACDVEDPGLCNQQSNTALIATTSIIVWPVLITLVTALQFV